ncbi:putative DNA-binding protein [Infectious spleen and kidney necrosis virus]|nr:putative DNA-binding protein [Infectious spleen and kidney necrosis virus]WNH14627.1 putative DNA-binding protein [Infectious spleen and kidney necrosis virus]
MSDRIFEYCQVAVTPACYRPVDTMAQKDHCAVATMTSDEDESDTQPRDSEDEDRRQARPPSQVRKRPATFKSYSACMRNPIGAIREHMKRLNMATRKNGHDMTKAELCAQLFKMPKPKPKDQQSSRSGKTMDNLMRKYTLAQMQQMCTERNIPITENGMPLYKHALCTKLFFDGDNARASTSAAVERVMARYTPEQLQFMCQDSNIVIMDDGRAVDKSAILAKLREQASSGEEGENVSGDDAPVEDNSAHGSSLGDATSNSGEQDEYADESHVPTMRECKVMATRTVIRMCEQRGIDTIDGDTGRLHTHHKLCQMLTGASPTIPLPKTMTECTKLHIEDVHNKCDEMGIPLIDPMSGLKRNKRDLCKRLLDMRNTTRPLQQDDLPERPLQDEPTFRRLPERPLQDEPTERPQPRPFRRVPSQDDDDDMLSPHDRPDKDSPFRRPQQEPGRARQDHRPSPPMRDVSSPFRRLPEPEDPRDMDQRGPDSSHLKRPLQSDDDYGHRKRSVAVPRLPTRPLSSMYSDISEDDLPPQDAVDEPMYTAVQPASYAIWQQLIATMSDNKLYDACIEGGVPLRDTHTGERHTPRVLKMELLEAVHRELRISQRQYEEPLYGTETIADLRRMCTMAGISIRDAHGDYRNEDVLRGLYVEHLSDPWLWPRMVDIEDMVNMTDRRELMDTARSMNIPIGYDYVRGTRMIEEIARDILYEQAAARRRSLYDSPAEQSARRNADAFATHTVRSRQPSMRMPHTLSPPQPIANTSPIMSTQQPDVPVIATFNKGLRSANPYPAAARDIRPHQETYLTKRLYQSFITPLQLSQDTLAHGFDNAIEYTSIEDMPLEHRESGDMVMTYTPYNPICACVKDYAAEKVRDVIREPTAQELETLEMYEISAEELSSRRAAAPKVVLNDRYYAPHSTLRSRDRVPCDMHVGHYKRYIDDVLEAYALRSGPEWRVRMRYGKMTPALQPLLSPIRSPAPPVPRARARKNPRPCQLKVSDVEQDATVVDYFQWSEQDYQTHTEWLMDTQKAYAVHMLLTKLGYQVTPDQDMREYLRQFTIRDFGELFKKLDPEGRVFQTPLDLKMYDGYFYTLESMLDYIDTSTGELRTTQQFQDYIRLNPQRNTRLRTGPEWTQVVDVIQNEIQQQMLSTQLGALDQHTNDDISDVVSIPQGSLRDLFGLEDLLQNENDFMMEYVGPQLTEWQPLGVNENQ